LTTWTALDTEGNPMINYNDGKWHKMNGVQPKSVHDLSDVEMKWILLDKGAIKESTRQAKQFGWEDSANVAGIAFRVIKQYKEPLEFWISHTGGLVFNQFEHRPETAYGMPLIHVREVLP